MFILDQYVGAFGALSGASGSGVVDSEYHPMVGGVKGAIRDDVLNVNGR